VRLLVLVLFRRMKIFSKVSVGRWGRPDNIGGGPIPLTYLLEV
jgi:hypothetical protein